jgi:AAA15 family ATPase/GTPase
MLIQFSVKNFRTFKEKVTLSLIASNYDKDTRELDNVYSDNLFNIRILKSAVVYGANASGKSKLIEALSFMKRFVITSSKGSQKGDEIEIEPFKLNIETESAPSEFEVIFTSKDVLYRYGFEVDKEQVVSEWLYYRGKTKEIELFYRDYQDFETHARNFAKGNTVIKQGLIRNNVLLISVAAQFNDEMSINVIDWFKNLKIISGLSEYGYQEFTMKKTDDPMHKNKILDLLQGADLGIQDIKLEKLGLNELPNDMPKELRDRIIKEIKEKDKQLIWDVLTLHKKYDDSKKLIGNVNFSLDDDESSGTKKFFALTGPILDVIENGYTLIVDELDSKLHPNLVCKIVSIFNSKDGNKENAQLVFNTHDTNLLSSGLFRRDQIWFTEKNKYGEAKLYSLADFKSDEVRKTEPFEENYIRGKYGAIPFLDSFDDLIKTLPQHENEG